MAHLSGRGNTPLGSAATDIVVREGFICPICMLDLGTVQELRDHFDLDHAEEDQSILQQLKGFVKKKVGIGDTSSSARQQNRTSSDDESTGSSSQRVFWDQQVFGRFQTHTEYFRKIRDSRLERYMVETNKLVIRLDKLAHEAPTDPRQRLAFEKHLASWVPDQDVPVCPGCGKSFKMFMRKHHCRLCGSVICNECSAFLEPDFVEKLTNPVGAQLRAPLGAKSVSSPKNGTRVMRSNSSESLMSVMASMASKDKEQLIRVCVVCRDLLDRRSRQMDEKHTRTDLEDLHERIAFAISDAEKIYPGYEEMVLSLQAGETNFQLSQAAELKNQLTRYFDTIDAFSKKVAALPETLNAKEEKLRHNVRINAVEYLKSRVLTMPPLPTADQCEELQRKRREEIKKRIAAHKEAEEIRRKEAPQRSSVDELKEVSRVMAKPKQKLTNSFEESSNPFGSSEESDDASNPFRDSDDAHPSKSRTNAARPKSRTKGGWAAEPIGKADIDEDDDPILQQISIVKKTIEQAKKAGRLEELASLTQNLDELNKFYRQNMVANL